MMKKLILFIRQAKKIEIWT